MAASRKVTPRGRQRRSGGGVLTDGDDFEPSFLALFYDKFFAVLRTEPVFVDLHTVAHPDGQVLGRLEVRYDNPWVHPCCS